MQTTVRLRVMSNKAFEFDANEWLIAFAGKSVSEGCMLSKIVVRSFGILLVASSLTACTMIPGSGPSAGAISREASEQYAPYSLVNVTSRTLAILKSRPLDNLSTIFGQARKANSSAIGVGDTVVIHIWESAQGGLFSGGGGSSAEIPEQPVSVAGTITVPYAGTVRVVGMTPDQVRLRIEGALRGKAIEPQVLVSVTKNLSNTVTVTGEVATSGRVPLSPRGERLLDIISISGGPRMEAHQLAVQVTRGSRTESIAMEQLVSDARENIYVQPNDVITLIRQPRSFTVFGATNANASVQFDESRLRLNQALAKVGGLDDQRANAKGVFVYRTEPAGLVARLTGVPLSVPADTKVNVIYQFDLQDPSGFFLLKEFEIYRDDLIYIANSSLAEVRKFATLVSTTASPIAQASSVNRLLNN
ncbi:hypothetical protein ASF70_09290 [Rhizobium sp. Leaf321]|nr:hypothetical protein ASF70_09290 [Rhizobium sp. Leaf321]